MKKVPKMVSTKDLSYICDIFNWNYTTAQKLEFYLENMDDEEICKEFSKLDKMHLKNCESLLKVLESCDNNE